MPRSFGSSHASALTPTTTRGGKTGRSPGTGLVNESGQAFLVEALPGGTNGVYRELPGGGFDGLPDLGEEFVRDNVVIANLAHDARGAVVSSALPPFASYVLGPDGSVRARLRPALSLLHDPVRGRLLDGSWIARPPVGIEAGFVQTFLNRGSARRIHVVYDRAGELLRSSETRIPIAFVGPSADAGEVLAVRRTDHPELVRYRLR